MTSPSLGAQQAPRFDRAELERRREELAGQVAELHWDLGGLAYEMAIRDHIDSDVLLRRAALLQERDAELAEVERKLGYERARDAGLGSAQAQAQGQAHSRAWARVLPPAQISVLLLVLFLGVGVALGAAAKGAARVGRLRPREVLVAQAAPVTGIAAAAPKISPPSSAATPTPSPSAETASSNEGAAGAPASSSSPTGAAGTKSSSRSSAGAGSSGGGSSGGGGGGAGGSTSSPSASGGAGAATKLPRVKHVFVVMLDDEPYATAFGPASPAHYLAGALEKKGELLVRYYAVAHEQLANGVALLSGQGPTPQTAQNCPTYEAITPGTVGSEEQVGGNGCVYPSATQTLPGQLTAKHLTWRAYLEGMDEGGAAGSGGAGSAGAGGSDGACGHPTLGAADPTSASSPPAGQVYATWRNPFVYFSSLTGSGACASDDVGLDKLKSDLGSVSSTPSFAYIVPGLCDDGSPTPCAPGRAAGMGAADGFLQRVVPEILASRAYRESGLLAITVDEAPSSGEFADSSSCCGQPSFPDLPAPAKSIGTPGGGQVGALLLSPFIKGGNLVQSPYNHFSLLRTVEDFFGLSHLGYASGSGVSSFSASLFTGSGK